MQKNKNKQSLYSTESVIQGLFSYANYVFLKRHKNFRIAESNACYSNAVK